jgi:hypothetical protein
LSAKKVERRPLSEVKVWVEGSSLVVEHEGHVLRFRAQPALAEDGIDFSLVREPSEEEHYFALMFGDVYWTTKEWCLRGYRGGGERLVVRCTVEKAVARAGDGYAVIYRPRLAAALERPLTEVGKA